MAFGLHFAELVEDQKLGTGIERTRHLPVHFSERRLVEPASAGAGPAVFEQIRPQPGGELFQHDIAMVGRFRADRVLQYARHPESATAAIPNDPFKG
ncbi:hypothetical protein LMTR13_20110 [Bradyrhizobium icense]|uniref:Uncharacterized protein n=1 Tax=Bradyrhizobium icense TaxID=1274631 RepID=A0A1B1UHA6_9BRAD|nr:hypothetical protein [Bradyrhizobium icense]ANW02135.1 hypothetical protein LMTR13_20110 [Bradyrhizobium icense]